MQGMMRLCARNVILFETYCCTRPILLKNFALTTNFKVYAKTCLPAIFSSLGCLSVLHFLVVLSNFLRAYPKPWEHQQRIDTYLDGAQPNLELCSILLNLLLLLLKDAGVHCNKTLIKPQKTKTRTFSIMFLFEVHALLFGLIPVSVTWESPVWKGFRLENLKSDIIRIQYPRFSKNMSWIQGRNLGSGSKIQDLRFWKACVGKPWIQQSHLDPRFLPWIQEKFFEYLGSCIGVQDFCPGTKIFFQKLGSRIRTQDFCLDLGSWIRAPWGPKFDSCSDLRSQVWQLSRLEIPSLRSHLLS